MRHIFGRIYSTVSPAKVGVQETKAGPAFVGETEGTACPKDGGTGVSPVNQGTTGKMPVPPILPEIRERICEMHY